MIFIFSLILGIVIALCAWVLFLKWRNPGIIDVFWSINIAVIALVFMLPQPWGMLQTLAYSLCLFWALRLSIYLFVTRAALGIVEKRYEGLIGKWRNPKLGFLMHCLLQGVLAWALAIPFYFIAQRNSIGGFDALIAVGIVLSIIAETHADLTLQRFKKNKKSGLCQQGLWRYSRHPNYFFEWLIWVGFALLGLGSLTSGLALLSPLLLYLIMRLGTIPITEAQSMEKRGKEFSDYQNVVSCFFPKKPKG